MSGLESREAEGFGDRRHDEDIRKRVNIAKVFPADKAGENDVSGNPELGGKRNEFGFFFAIPSENKDKFRVFMNRLCGGVEKVSQTLLDSETSDGRDNTQSVFFQEVYLDVLGIIEGIKGVYKVLAEGVIDYVDFFEGNVVFFMDNFASRI